MEQSNAIELKEIKKIYPGFCLNIPELKLPRGCIMGLIGENGAGKSTLIKLMLGLVHQQEGDIVLLGQSNKKNLHLIKEDIGVVLDQGGIPESLTPVQTGRVMQGTFSRWNQEYYEYLVDRWKLPRNKVFKEFSRGMKMKQQLAVALSHEAKLLILDEATNGLDPLIRDEMLDILAEYARKEEHSVLLSSHIVSDLEKITDYIAFLHQGELLMCKEKDDLMEAYGLLQCSRQELSAFPREAVWVKRDTPYGVEAVVDRRYLGNSYKAGSVTLEELFIAMVKEKR